MVTEVVQRFWAAMQRGEFITDAAAEAGTYRKKGARWLVAAGGVRPRRGRDLKGRCLSFSEREEIALARAGGESMRAIARRLQRSPSTISRELQRNAGCSGQPYRATTAHALAYERAGRPKPSKLATNLALRKKVEQDLQRRYSPEQIAGRLRQEFPQNAEMRVSTETIYQSLYVQSRVALRRDLARCLRTGRALRRPCRQPGQRKNRIPDMINIAQRPAEADDRAVPGHWEGDLIIGKSNASAIGTLVERTTGQDGTLGPDPSHLGKDQRSVYEEQRRALTQDIARHRESREFPPLDQATNSAAPKRTWPDAPCGPRVLGRPEAMQRRRSASGLGMTQFTATAPPKGCSGAFAAPDPDDRSSGESTPALPRRSGTVLTDDTFAIAIACRERARASKRSRCSLAVSARATAGVGSMAEPGPDSNAI